MDIKEIRIDELKPYIKNNKLHPLEQIEKIAASIKEFGFNVPILIDKNNNIIAGHGRLEACKILDISKVPTLCLDNLDKDQIKAYRIMDNKSAESDWNKEFLTSELKELQMNDFNMDLTGFNGIELNELFGDNPDNIRDVEPEDAATVETTIKRGNVILLGNHRLMCGDSTSSEDVGILMQDEKADMCFTDPPYNIGFSGTMSCTSKDGKIITMKDGYNVPNSQYENIKNDNKDSKSFNIFIKKILNNIRLFTSGGWYICFSSSTLNELLNPLIELNMKWKSIIIWNKNQSPMGGGHYRKKYEPIVYGYFENIFHGKDYSEDDVWDFQRTLKNDLHPTMKPIPLVTNAIKNSSKQNDIVLDLFGGSGSTLIAADQLNRKCLMMELDTQYCEVICQRWEKLTGEKRVMI